MIAITDTTPLESTTSSKFSFPLLNTPYLYLTGPNIDYIFDVSVVGKNGIIAYTNHNLNSDVRSIITRPQGKTYGIFG